MKPTRSDHLSDAELALKGMSRETDIVLDAQGRFFAGGQPVVHPKIVAAFSRWIDRTPAGRYVLRNDLHYVYIDVKGAPLHARAVDLDDATQPPQVVLLLQGGEREPLDPTTLVEGPAGDLYARVRDGSWPVRLHPAAVLALEPWLLESNGEPSLEIGKRVYPIRRVADPLS